MRRGTASDAVRGVVPTKVYTPASVEECSDLLPHTGKVAFLGGGTELDLGGAPPALDSVVRTSAMARIVEYAPADMVMIVEAGASLAAVQAAARAHGQRLALDPPAPERATIGGLVATGAFGPRRAAYGPIRDLIIGVTLVRADGGIAHGGGKVVKNVAGFDLPKLACGSLGTLAMIASATFRLHPLPEEETTVVATGLTAAEVVAQVARARQAQLEPSSVVAIRGAGGYDLAFRFEGFARGVREQAARLGAPFSPETADFWARHDAIRAGGPSRVRITSLPTRLPAVDALVSGDLVWYASLGIGFVSGPVTDLGAARAALVAAGGALVVEAGPGDPWGPPPPAFDLMAALKHRFDPEGRLNPGRFVGGL